MDRLIDRRLRAACWVVGLSGLCEAGCKTKAPPAPPPPAVLVALVERRDVPIYLDAVASLDGYVNADIRARVKGYLKSQTYKDGGAVRRGQVLFSIEPTDYVASVKVARAAVSRASVARAHNKVEAERDENLFRTGTISRHDLDDATAILADTDGQVQSARAQLDQAALSLSYTDVASPIDGVAGIALVRVGNLVGQDGPTVLTTVSQIDPMRVNFPMAESDFLRYREGLAHLESRDLAWAKGAFAKLDDRGATDDGDGGVELILADGTAYAHRGVTVAANRQVDPTTGTIQIQALFPNAQGVLRPGSYGRIRIRRRDAGQNALVVPEKALVSVQGAYSVGLVGAGNKVELRRVEVGPSAQGLRLITSGVQEGDRIVVEGVQKIIEGGVVDPKLEARTPPASSSSPRSGASGAPAPGPAASND